MRKVLFLVVLPLLCSCASREYKYPSFPLSDTPLQGPVKEVVLEYSIKPGMLMRLLWNSLQNDSMMSVVRVERYDMQHRPIEASITSDGYNYHGFICEYGANNCIQIPFHCQQQDTSRLKGQILTTFNANGQIVSTRSLDQDGGLIDSIVYGADGEIFKKLNYEKGQLLASYQYQYSKEGLLEKCSSGADGSLVYSVKYNRGKVRKVVKDAVDAVYNYDTNGRLIAVCDSLEDAKFSDFDEYGNWRKKVSKSQHLFTTITTRDITYYRDTIRN